MDLKKKLLITLFTLSATTILAILSLIFVLVDNPQGFTTDFDISYIAPELPKVSFAVSGVENTTDFTDITFENTYILYEPAIPKIHNKMLVSWYTDEALTNKAEFPLTITESTTLYPYFKDGNVDGYIEWNTAGYYQIKNTTYTKVDGVTECVIPDYYNDGTNGLHALTTIVSAFLNVTDGSGITDVYVGNNITAIPPQFAYKQIAISNLVLGYNIQTIETSAFEYIGLTSLVIPSNVKTIGDRAFCYCVGMTGSLVIPSNVKTIGEEAFNRCENLTSITIPSSVTSIGCAAFVNCRNLTSITIQSGVTSIGDGAFYYCHKLSSITIPSSVTSIGYDAFDLCSKLTSLIFESPTGWTKASNSGFTSNVTNNIDLSNPTQNATWFTSTSGYCNYYWKRV